MTAALSTLGKAAIAYAKTGLRVFPVQARDKVPLGQAAPNGCKNATTDPAKITAWWAEFPEANVGIACGNGLVILDVDAGHGGDDSIIDLEQEHGKLPDTPMVLTGGGGRHYYFSGEAKNKVALALGIDVRGDGGYVVAPPSIHPNGRTYLWEESSRLIRPDAIPLAPAPPWMVGGGKRSQKNGTTIDRVDAVAILEGIPEGERDETIFKYACKLRADPNMSKAEAIVLIEQAARRAKPPFDVATAKEKVDRAWEKYDSKLLRDLGASELTAPLVTTADRTVRLEWISRQISAEARALKEHTDGRITGSLRIWTTLPGIGRDLRSAQFNFAALGSRKELAKDLSGKLPEVPWDAMIELLCAKVTEFIQGGDPIEIVRPSDKITPTTFVLWPILIKDCPTVVFGQEGSAKSYLALLLCYLSMLDQSVADSLGMRLDSRIKSVLYLDWEGKADALRERMKYLANGMGLEECPISYRRCSRSLAMDLDQIKSALGSTKPDLLVIDSLIPAVGGDPLASQTANEFFTALRSFDCTSLLIGHTPKHTGGTAAATVFGSGVFQFLARSIWEIRRHQEEDEADISVGLFHKKINYGRSERPVGFRFQFGPSSTIVTREDVTGNPEMESALGLSSRIVGQLLENGTMTPKQLSEALDVPQNKIRGTLAYLRSKERVVAVKRGIWGCLTKDRAPF